VAIEVQGWQFTAQWPPSELETPARAGLRRGAPVTLEELDLIPADEDAPGRLSEAEALEQLAGAALASPEEVPPLIASLEEASLLVRRGVRLHPTRQGQRLLERLGAEQPGLLDVHRARDFTRQIAGIAAGRHGRAAVLAPFERWLREGGAPSPPATPPASVRRSRERPRGLGLRCPRCARGEIVERRKRGAPLPFFACSRYPECRFTSSATPVAGPCPSCGAPLLRARARRTFCAEPGCGYARRGSSEPIIGA
jgi:hypothetical protein